MSGKFSRIPAYLAVLLLATPLVGVLGHGMLVLPPARSLLSYWYDSNKHKVSP